MMRLIRRAEAAALAGALAGIGVMIAVITESARPPGRQAMFDYWLGTAVITAVSVFVLSSIGSARRRRRQSGSGGW